ncbi:hypothetical protein [Methanolobus vulcani]|uniref:Uncharacterized protein n=1 Tax=Methanolobus vulcani TaxID=38026 RepID=A0A7Z8KPI3_9EURY|nr:hypothetical protein [Methanolobus vulcani]TQD25181.1 hypothetical protein FKV42_09015 [Methanolobus vulcani]
MLGRKIRGALQIALLVTLLLTGTAYAFTSDLEDSPRFITTRGTVPDTISQEWDNSIIECYFNLTKNKPYSQFDISIASYGAHRDNWIEVELDPAYQEEINETRIDEIYTKITVYCEQNYNLSEVPIVFMWTDSDYSLPDLGQNGFEEAEKLSGFIEARGTIPDITESGKKREWYGLLYANAPVSKIEAYMVSNGGHVVSFGTDINGYLTVDFDSTYQTTVNESTIDEMYELIEAHYEKAGINDVPVVFVGGVEIILDEGEEAPSETNILPDFSSEMLVFMLFMAIGLRRN